LTDWANKTPQDFITTLQKIWKWRLFSLVLDHYQQNDNSKNSGGLTFQ